MIIHNTTFIIDRNLSEDFLVWFRSFAHESLCKSSGLRPRLTILREVPGDPDFNAQAFSYAFQLEFPTLLEANEWVRTHLTPVMENFTATFGIEKSMTFPTILEEIEL